MRKSFIHEESYNKLVEGAVHRNRLQHIIRAFRQIEINSQGMLGDFGCSNGFVIEQMQKLVFKEKDWHFEGLDHSQALLDLAMTKQLPKTNFQFVDLNEYNPALTSRFDIVTCFEVLEHVGNLAAALKNLYNSCRSDGYIIISVPNEKGVPGLVKYLGRKLIRKKAYGDFFKNQSEFAYVLHLLLNRRLDGFRKGDQLGWGPHLGFDVRVLQGLLHDEYIKTGKVELRRRWHTRWGFNIIVILSKKA